LLVAAAALLTAGSEVTNAQQAEFEGEVSVNIIEVPVRVIDPETGAAVTGLAAKDFRITENGRRKKITNFAEIGRPDRGTTAQGGAALEQRPIQMVYFFDLYLMRSGPRDEAAEALTARYTAGVPDGEEVSIVVFDGALQLLVDRSTDRREIADSVDAVRSMRARGIEHETAFTPNLANEGDVTGTRDLAFYERRQRSIEYVFELERRVARVGDAISAAMARYAQADARKVLVAFTPGQPMTSWAPTYSPVDFANNAAPYPAKDLWEAVAHEASDLGFTFYAIDSSGISATLIREVDVAQATTETIGSSDADSGGFAFGSGSNSENIELWLERVRKDTLISASETTGGEALFAKATTAIDEVARDLDHYYSLAYSAKHRGDGNVHTIEVTLPDHPQFVVQSRSAYIDRPASERAAKRLQSTMLFGGDANPLGARVELGDAKSRLRIGAAGMKKVRLPIVIKVPIGRLTMVERGRDYWGKITVTVFGEDDTGNQSDPVTDSAEIRVPAREIQRAKAVGYFSYDLTVTIEGGQQRVWVGIEDVVGDRISIMPQELRF
jgi:VWFA-related protein